MELIVFGVAAITIVMWVAHLLKVTRVLRSIPALPECNAPDIAWPRLSIVIPACNEADTIEDALRSLLDADYPDLQIVVVDDRSVDGTGEIIDRVCAHDPRALKIRIDDLPQGWLGKVHALSVGAARATGDWILFTDADVHFAPGVLQRAVYYAEKHGLDHLGAMPDVEGGEFLVNVAVDAFGLSLLASASAFIAEGGATAMGVGAFNLVRRETLEGSEGFDWIRLEIADDVALAVLLARAGAKSAFVLATGQVRVLWYETVGQMAAGLEKSMYAVVGRFSVVRSLLAATLMVLLAIGPFGALLTSPWLLVPLAMAWAVNASCLRQRLRRPAWRTLLVPVGYLLFAFMVVRSVWFCRRNGGVVWRGTHYDLELLKSGQRLRFGGTG